MGSEEDPKDGGAVAGAVFGAVFIYIVRLQCAEPGLCVLLIYALGILCLLRIPGLLTPAREPEGRDKSVSADLGIYDRPCTICSRQTSEDEASKVCRRRWHAGRGKRWGKDSPSVLDLSIRRFGSTLWYSILV